MPPAPHESNLLNICKLLIFLIFDADADNPKYYTFAKTDAYLGGIVKNGTQITYRLGETIECRSCRYFKGGL